MGKRQLLSRLAGDRQYVPVEVRNINVAPSVAVDIGHPSSIVSEAGQLHDIGEADVVGFETGATRRTRVGDIRGIEYAKKIPWRRIVLRQVMLARREEWIFVAARIRDVVEIRIVDSVPW